MSVTDFEAENIQLKAALSSLKKEHKKMTKQFEKAKRKTANLRQELKKKDVRKVGLSKEQEQLLSNLLEDINIQNLLSD